MFKKIPISSLTCILFSIFMQIHLGSFVNIEYTKFIFNYVVKTLTMTIIISHNPLSIFTKQSNCVFLQSFQNLNTTGANFLVCL